ncbi:MAG TPA: hypothetical protein VN688_30000 [Gemmataceae bacterium]|nr:hypothetical protein [Gemmataceae bacterium]
MIIRHWFPALSASALALICFSADCGQAGSFFGPTCYGAGYTNEYPNRSHNAFGCGPNTQCTARHPLFKHRWLRKHQAAPANGAPVNGVPVNGMPVNGAPVEYMQAPIVQSPYVTTPVQATAVLPAPIAPAPVTPAPVTPAPAVSARIAPVPAPLPTGPVNAEPSIVNQTSKPPF